MEAARMPFPKLRMTGGVPVADDLLTGRLMLSPKIAPRAKAGGERRKQTSFADSLSALLGEKCCEDSSGQAAGAVSFLYVVLHGGYDFLIAQFEAG